MAYSYIVQAQSEGTPIIQGEKVTFLWQGREAPTLVGDFNDWEEGKHIRLSKAGTQLWTTTLTLPRDAYIEYAFVKRGETLEDPLNPRLVYNGMGQYNNYFYMPEAGPTPLAARVKGAPRGVIARYSVATDDLAVHKQRSIYLYQPPAQGPYPLLLVWDGRDYLQRASLAHIVDNLILQQRIRPVAMVFVNNGGQARMVEYTCSEATLNFILHAVLPLARERLNLIDISTRPGSFGVLGASLGGLMALFAGLRLPHIFGNVLSQSGAFAHFGREYVVYNLVRMHERLPIRIWMDVGKFEELLETNRRMAGLLQSKGYPLIYREFPAGHNYSAWRDDIWRGLEYLFGVPAEDRR